MRNTIADQAVCIITYLYCFYDMQCQAYGGPETWDRDRICDFLGCTKGTDGVIHDSTRLGARGGKRNQQRHTLCACE